MGRESEQIVFRRRHTDDQQVHKKLHKITNHQGNTNQTTVSYHLTPVRMAVIKKTRINECWRGYGERGPLGTTGGTYIWRSHHGK